MILSIAEENYLKAILSLSGYSAATVSTSALAQHMDTAPASVTDMLRRLSDKELIDYKPYYGAQLTETGRYAARMLVRKHRLWEVWLVEHLEMAWESVHAVAEQLEHVRSDELIDRLDHHLGYPRTDPHGASIPDAQGHVEERPLVALRLMQMGTQGILRRVVEDERSFLEYLNSLSLRLGSTIEVLQTIDYDHSIQIRIDGGLPIILTEKMSRQLLMEPSGPE